MPQPMIPLPIRALLCRMKGHRAGKQRFVDPSTGRKIARCARCEQTILRRHGEEWNLPPPDLRVVWLTRAEYAERRSRAG